MKVAFEESETFKACINFAGLKIVAESSKLPLKYYSCNVSGVLNLLELIDEHDCHTIIFSFPATVHDSNNSMPLIESSLSNLSDITNPHGKIKCIIEVILLDLFALASDK